MRLVLSALMASALLVGLTGSGEAAQKKRYYSKGTYGQTVPSHRYSGATVRQRANSAAFEHGGYYESIPDQHVFGSRSWWFMKQRELGGGGRS
jgi:hypothetical protein